MHTVLKRFVFYILFSKFSQAIQSSGELSVVPWKFASTVKSEVPWKFPGSSLRLCKAKFPGSSLQLWKAKFPRKFPGSSRGTSQEVPKEVPRKFPGSSLFSQLGKRTSLFLGKFPKISIVFCFNRVVLANFRRTFWVEINWTRSLKCYNLFDLRLFVT